ncbi:hypothetical protein QJS10_CPA01g01478 [Acorus calamus]|uniref:Uncharacterized protein n=1 Tax=Acorus calamus TaxID=4465 RepID=A0AAV9FJ66_ACOCL|nr:hypothetical protein QJS10_CPA01g01478 [Acorus calamus]
MKVASGMDVDFEDLEDMWRVGKRMKRAGRRSVKAKVSQLLVPALVWPIWARFATLPRRTDVPGIATPELYEVPPEKPLPLKPQSLHIFRCTTPPDRKAAQPEIEGEGESQPSMRPWNLRTRRLRIGSQTQRLQGPRGGPLDWGRNGRDFNNKLTEVTQEETCRVP